MGSVLRLSPCVVSCCGLFKTTFSCHECRFAIGFEVHQRVLNCRLIFAIECDVGGIIVLLLPNLELQTPDNTIIFSNLYPFPYHHRLLQINLRDCHI
jgi:hypothetical protein